jgi:hypothetical protein
MNVVILEKTNGGTMENLTLGTTVKVKRENRTGIIVQVYPAMMEGKKTLSSEKYVVQFSDNKSESEPLQRSEIEVK